MPKLKCWKKIREQDDYLLYQFIKVPRGAEVQVSHHYFLKTKVPLYWGVSIWKTDRLTPSIQDKPFETKKEATQFAMKYMKNHDRC